MPGQVTLDSLGLESGQQTTLESLGLERPKFTFSDLGLESPKKTITSIQDIRPEAKPSFFERLAIGPAGDIVEGALETAAYPIETVAGLAGGMAGAVARPLVAGAANLQAMITGKNPRALERSRLAALEKIAPYFTYTPQGNLARTTMEVAASPFTGAAKGLETAGVPEEIAGPAVEAGALALPLASRGIRSIRDLIQRRPVREIAKPELRPMREEPAFVEELRKPPETSPPEVPLTPEMRIRPEEGVRAEPARFEPTQAGMQGVLEVTPQRETPTTALRAKGKQAEGLTPLERATIPETQMELGKVEKPVPSKAPLTPEEQAAANEMRGILGGRKPRPRLDDSEVAVSTFIQRRGGMNIPKELKEEFGGWNRLHKKDALAVDEMAGELYEAGLIPEPTTNALIAGLKSKQKTARFSEVALDRQALAVAVEDKIREMSETPADLEYKGKTYKKAIPEKEGVRLIDDKDVVLKKDSDILSVEEKIPFEVPEPGAGSLDAISNQNQGQVLSARKAEGERASIMIGKKKFQKEASTEIPAVDEALTSTANKGFVQGLRDIKEKFLSNLQFEREVSHNPLLVDDLRLFQGEKRRALTEAKKDLDGIVGNLKTGTELEQMSRIVEIRDMISRLKSGQTVQNKLTLDQAESALANLTKKASPEVLDAAERHFKLVDAVGSEKIERGWMNPEAKREDYFRHRVLRYDSFAGPATPRRIKPPGKEKAAKGSALPIERDYIRVMYDYLAKHRYDKALEDFIETQSIKLDRTPEVKAALGKDFQGHPGQIVEINGQHLKAFQFDPGNQVYPEVAIKDSVINKAIKKGLEELRIPIDELEAVKVGERVTESLQKSLAIGRKKPIRWLDIREANRLEKFRGIETDDTIRLVNSLTSKWKGLTIDFGGTAFQLMNLTGDIANIARADVSALAYIPRAFRMLRKGNLDSKVLVTLGEELEVLNSGFVPREASKLMSEPEFNRFLPPAKRLVYSAATQLDKLIAFSNYRENVPRLALFLSNVSKLEGGEAGLVKALKEVPIGQRLAPIAEKFAANRTLKTAEVKTENLPPIRAAAKVAREIPVDYGKFTPAENRYLRGLLLPFYSWTKQNTTGWLTYIAKRPAQFAGLVLAPWAAMELWNHSNYPEIEENLPDYLKTSPHIITGYQDAKGKEIVLDLRSLPAASALETIGLSGVPSRLSALMREQINLTDAGKKTLEDIIEAPKETFFRLLSPFLKVPAEIFRNKTFFTKQELVPKEIEGTTEATKLRGRYAIESLFRPVREARLIKEQVQKEEFDPLSNRFLFGLPLRHIDIGKSARIKMFQSQEESRNAINEQLVEAAKDEKGEVNLRALREMQRSVGIFPK